VDFDGDEEYGTAYSKHRRESSDFRKITVGTAHGQYYTLVIFSNQEDDIADLIGEPVGSRIAVMAREIDYGRRYDGCLRVTSVIDLEEFDKVRHELASSRLVAKSLVMGITKDQMIERLVRNMINSSSHGWKLDQTPTSRAIPL
jgi:hypothetical protein